MEKRDEGMRYRWLGDTNGGIRNGGEERETAATRYTGIQTALYARGEAVGLNRTASTGTRGESVYLGKDILGSVRSASNEYGVLEDRYEYDAFGKPYKGEFGDGMNLGYTGKPYDAVTGLYNYGYRDYAPEVARFTSEDPIRDGSNWFAYVNNDPVNWVDPWGLSANEPKQGFIDNIKGVAETALSVFGFVTNSISNIAEDLGYGVKVKAVSFASNIISVVSTVNSISKAIEDPNPDTISDVAITAVGFVPVFGDLASVEAAATKKVVVQTATATAKIDQTLKRNPMGFLQNVFDYFVTYK